MAVQSKDSYSVEHKPLHVGQLANLKLFNSVSGLVGTEAITFGKGVVRDGDKIKLAANASEAQKFLGVVMYELNRAVESTGDGKVAANSDATIITIGDIAVRTETSTNVGDAVYLVYGSSGRGNFSNSATSAQILDSWEWKTSTSAGAIGVIGLKANIVLPVAAE